MPPHFPSVTRARARARNGDGNQRPWPADKVETMDRPALQRVLADITAGRVDTVVVYKIDRLEGFLYPSYTGGVVKLGAGAIEKTQSATDALTALLPIGLGQRGGEFDKVFSNIDISRRDFNRVAHAAGHLSRDYRRARAAERLVDGLPGRRIMPALVPACQIKATEPGV
jgi:hypothetical protein